jgi:hypothetical protein
MHFVGYFYEEYHDERSLEHKVIHDMRSTNPQMSNFIKFRPVGAELFHADTRTDRHT